MTDGTPTPLAEGGDPGDFTVDQVNGHLAKDTTDDTERERVLQAERNGQARVGILGKPDANGNLPTDPEPAVIGAVEQGEAVKQLGAETVELRLSQHWTDPTTDKAYPPGAKVTVPAATAVTLLGTRWARRADEGDDE